MRFPGEHLLLSRRVLYVGILLLFFVVLSSCTPLASAPIQNITSTLIPSRDGNIPIFLFDDITRNQLDSNKKLLVHVSNSTQIDDNDNGGLAINPCDSNQIILAWAEDYQVGVHKCDGETSYNIYIKPLTVDNSVVFSLMSDGDSCSGCHSKDNIYGYEYEEATEWNQSSHAAHNNGYFENMYFGTNSSGVQSPVTQPTIINNELVRNQPDGIGFKLDRPNEPGNCAFCHVPNPIIPTKTAYSLQGGAFYERLTCDTCHKVLNIDLDDNGYPLPDRPGILSFEYLPSNNQYIIGPFANINIKGESTFHNLTCSQVFNRSEFCAACHYGQFGGMWIYNSFGEWKQSKYGDNPRESDYKTCQDCHMSHFNPDTPTAPFSERDGCTEAGVSHPEYSHNLLDYELDPVLNRSVPNMIRGAAEIESPEISYEPDKMNSLGVVVRVKNVKAGHKFPTDSPLRHLILVVDAQDRLHTSLAQTDGKIIPNWGGMGITLTGMESYGRQAGKIFANLLVERDTNISPTAAYWNPTKLAWVNAEEGTDSDTRLKPGITDESKYYFAVPSNGDVTISVKLIYRYAFIDLVYQKGWTRPDIVVAEWVCTGPPKAPIKMRCDEHKQ